MVQTDTTTSYLRVTAMKEFFTLSATMSGAMPSDAV